MLQLQPLMRYSNQSTQPLKMSERKLMQLKFLNEAERNFYDKYGREPSDIELADTLGWSRKAIGKVRAYSRPIVGAYNDIDNEDSSDPAVGGQDRSKMWMEYVYHDADPTDKKIMEWKFGLGGRPVKSNNEIASALRISSSAVTQRATKLQNKLLQGMALKYG
jgi:DNA-directed RNA polymerase specialized sigma subunit